jgi:hypothetical protein
MIQQLPLLPQKRKLDCGAISVAVGHEQTHASQQTNPYSSTRLTYDEARRMAANFASSLTISPAQ